MIWTKTGSQSFKVSVSDPTTGLQTSLSRNANYFGFVSYPSSFACDQGAMQGQPGVSVSAGTAIVLNYDHSVNAAPSPLLYIIGDSISEGSTLISDSQKYAAILRQKLGTNQVVVSAIAGAVTSGALGRLTLDALNMAIARRNPHRGVITTRTAEFNICATSTRNVCWITASSFLVRLKEIHMTTHGRNRL